MIRNLSPITLALLSFASFLYILDPAYSQDNNTLSIYNVQNPCSTDKANYLMTDWYPIEGLEKHVIRKILHDILTEYKPFVEKKQN